MARHTQILQTNACLCYITGLCHLCPVGAQVGAAGRRKVARKGLQGQFRAILSFSVVRSPESPPTLNEPQAPHHAAHKLTRLIPCLSSSALKFSSNPTRTPESRRYVKICAVWIGSRAFTAFSSTMTAFSTSKSTR